MADLGYLLGIYLHLAQAGRRRQRPHVANRFLVLAATIATEMGLSTVAAHCRQLVLQNNPHHLIRRWPHVSEALQNDDFECLVQQLQRRYPTERAERLLEDLGIELGRERESYFSDYEYAAALLGTTTAQLDKTYSTG